MIKVNITWPLLMAFLIALIVYLARDPKPHRPLPERRTPSRPTPRTSRRPIIIEQPSPVSDYDAETERLDREAAEAARTVFEESEAQRELIIERLNQRNDRRKARFNTRR